jgi:prepilin-type processing-associated H-X9-DG protein
VLFRSNSNDSDFDTDKGPGFFVHSGLANLAYADGHAISSKRDGVAFNDFLIVKK